MEPEVIDFGLIRSQDSPERSQDSLGGNYDTSFANWLVARRGLSANEGRNTAYRIRRISEGNLPRTKEDAERLGMKVMLDTKMSKSTKYGYLYTIERWMAYIGVPVKFAHKPQATSHSASSSTRSHGGPTRPRPGARVTAMWPQSTA